MIDSTSGDWYDRDPDRYGRFRHQPRVRCTARPRVEGLDQRRGIGGVFHYAMAYRPGHEMYGRFVYREIAAPGRLVFVNSFSDAAGGITRAPFPQLGDRWPLEVLNNMTLTEKDGKTTLTLRGGPINAT